MNDAEVFIHSLAQQGIVTRGGLESGWRMSNTYRLTEPEQMRTILKHLDSLDRLADAGHLTRSTIWDDVAVWDLP